MLNRSRLRSAGRRRLLLIVLGLIVSAVAVYVLVQSVDLAATGQILARASLGPLAVVVGLVAFQLVLRTVRWRYLLPSPDGNRPPIRRLVPVLAIGYLGNAVLPARLGEPIRAVLVARRERIPVAGALGSVMLERVLDLATLAAVAFVAAVLVRAPDWMIYGSATVGLLGLGVAAVLVLVDVNRLANWVQTVVAPRITLAHRLADVLRDFGTGAGGQPQRLILVALAISGACWMIDGTMFFLVSHAVGSPVDWSAGLLISAITVLGTAIPSAPGYVGTYELAAVGAGVALGYPGDSLLAIALLTHVLSTGLLALGGAAALIALQTQRLPRDVSRDTQRT